jgi:hypothetical protein
VARKGREVPSLIEAIRTGQLHLSGACLVAKYLTPANAMDLLAKIALKSKRDIDEILASEFSDSLPESKKESVRRVKRATPPPPAPPPLFRSEPCPESKPLQLDVLPPPKEGTPEHPDNAPIPAPTFEVRIGVTFDQESYDLLTHLMKFHPGESMAAVLVRGLHLLQAKSDPAVKAEKTLRLIERRQTTGSPADSVPTAAKPKDAVGRKALPAQIKARVWQRDEGRCTYVSPNGERCSGTHKLQFDHVHAVALGGGDSVENLRMRCRLHNTLAAVETFGADWMGQWIRLPRGKSGLGQMAPINASDPI